MHRSHFKEKKLTRMPALCVQIRFPSHLSPRALVAFPREDCERGGYHHKVYVFSFLFLLPSSREEKYTLVFEPVFDKTTLDAGSCVRPKVAKTTHFCEATGYI